MNELKRQLSTRDGAENFRDFLLRTSTEGLETFQLWLILNGYQKEVERHYRLRGFDLTFCKWNQKCARAVSEKYLKRAQIEPVLRRALNNAYANARRQPTEEHSKQLTQAMGDIFDALSLLIETKYYTVYANSSGDSFGGEVKSLLRPSELPLTSQTHQNSKHMSPLGSDFASSDNHSSVTDFTSVIDPTDTKRTKRRNKHTRRLHLLRNVISRQANTEFSYHHCTMPRLTNEADLATKAPAEFARLLALKLAKVAEAAEDDSILSEHLERVMKTPKDKPRRPYRRPSNKIRVTDWLAKGSNECSNSSYERDEYVNFAHHETNNYTLPLLSSDSGLSSIRVDTEAEENEELNAVKQRLIEETEGAVTTKLLYHFNHEKFIVRVPGRPPTLASLRQKMHCQGDYRYFVKEMDDAWVEVTDDNEPIFVNVNNVAEAKVI